MRAARSVHLTGMTTDNNPLSVLDPLVTIAELAEYLGVPVKTIYEWRQTGRGPIGVRIGRHVKFRLSDVKEWVDGQCDLPSSRAQRG